jgi:hypothetical protein
MVHVSSLSPGDTVLVIDTTYFGREFGIMVFRCAIRKQNLFWKFVSWETTQEYVGGISYLKQCGWNILGLVCDGRRGVLTAFPSIPTQMCQFHQIQIVTRYITRHPKLEAGKDLRNLTLLLSKTDKESFTYWLTEWHNKWQNFLNEKAWNPEKRKFNYIHRRLRSAYRSLKTNLPHLFTFYDNPQLGIPNTTNTLDGFFSSFKKKVNIHRGLSFERKKKVIIELLSSNHPHKIVH